MVSIPKTLSDHPSLVGIVRFPSCNVTTQEVPVPLVIKDNENNYMSLRQIVDMAVSITGNEKPSNGKCIKCYKCCGFGYCYWWNEFNWWWSFICYKWNYKY